MNAEKEKMKKILIANRGEIAIRIMKTARKMKILTVAIRTAAEPDAMYLSFADEVFDNTEDLSEIPVFLDIEKLISIALATGSDALHPGYGFLAENAYFAQKCLDNNLNFIGPTPDAIYKMGNKTIARRLAMQNGIPLAMGSDGNISDEEEAVAMAEKIGYPVIIKAASGGGGRGMRIVRDEVEMVKMFSVASREAEKAFKDPSVFIEKYIENPKHIEFQILGDKKGNIIHLGERECSIQRKHQKLLEEAPSVALDPSLRKKMGSMAVRIAKAVKYLSAGTVEFLLDSEKNFYFMEMNTRIQVEHPITEEVTGFDLVQAQIRAAAGEVFRYAERDFEPRGHAIEVRVNAENPYKNFTPSPGPIQAVHFPGGPGIRVDSHVYSGYEIPPYYDSMIAKIIARGRNRDEALTRMARALAEFKIAGPATTVPVAQALLADARFLRGEYTTAFLEHFMNDVFWVS